MSRYRQGLSVSELRARFYEDVGDGRSADELVALYGADRARFLGADAEHHFRPTSVHAGSPLYRDALGREYTPYDTPTSREWLVRIPPQYARRAAAALRAGDRPAPKDLVDYPQPGEELRLTRVRPGRRRSAGSSASDGDVVDATARVQSVSDTRARASCVVSLQTALPSDRSAAERDTLERRAGAEQQRRLERVDRRY